MTRRGLLIACCFLAGCGASHPVPPVESPVGSPADALSVVRNGGDPVSSLRATFTARVHRGDSNQRANGVLLVQKPDRVRLRLSSPLGFTILDYTSNGGSDRLWLASEDRTLSGDELTSTTSFSPDAVRWIFLRGDRFGEDCRERDAPEWIIVECGDQSGAPRYRGYVQRDSRLLLREVILDGDEPRLTVVYADYRPTAGVRVPYSIEWTETKLSTRVTIDIDSYEVNPELPVRLFTPPA